jgi:pyruvate dehydrogenase E2 component (dihydrolipoamide acetyltransferase)
MTEFKLPDLGENIEEAEVTQIFISEGDVIEVEQNVLELESEKATFELPCPHAGKVVKVHVKEGDTLSVGQTLLSIDEAVASSGDGDKPPEVAAQPAPTGDEPAAMTEPVANTESAATPVVEEGPPPAPEPAKTAAEKPAAREVPKKPAEPKAPAIPIAAGPATRRLARELGVDLQEVSGSGPGGRITEDDVKEHVQRRLSTPSVGVQAPSLPDFSVWGPIEVEPLNKIARTSAQRLSIGWQAPHVTQHEQVDITALEDARRRFMKGRGKEGPKVTMTALAIKASITALKTYPHVNSSLDLVNGQLIVKRYYHIGVAVDTERGLLVPVVRDADQKSLLEVAAEIAELAEKARDKKITLEEMQGGTFTITNLGSIGGAEFTPIINSPEVAILGIGRGRWQAVLSSEGEIENRLMLPLSLSYDHRVVNGADGARFITKLSALLKDPFELLAEC